MMDTNLVAQQWRLDLVPYCVAQAVVDSTMLSRIWSSSFIRNCTSYMGQHDPILQSNGLDDIVRIYGIFTNVL